MKTLVVYDSRFGNTKKIAEAIAGGVGDGTMAKNVNEVKEEELKGLDLLVAGSPVHGGRPSEDMLKFLDGLDETSLEGVNVAAFDSRFSKEGHGFFLNQLMKVLPYAAPKIEKYLEKNGGKGVSEPQGFIVNDTKGPVAKGELERARKWGRKLTGM